MSKPEAVSDLTTLNRVLEDRYKLGQPVMLNFGRSPDFRVVSLDPPVRRKYLRPPRFYGAAALRAIIDQESHDRLPDDPYAVLQLGSETHGIGITDRNCGFFTDLLHDAGFAEVSLCAEPLPPEHGYSRRMQQVHGLLQAMPEQP